MPDREPLQRIAGAHALGYPCPFCQTYASLNRFAHKDHCPIWAWSGEDIEQERATVARFWREREGGER